MNVTMSDIAARAGTTTGVVSVTLNGAKSKTLRVSEATRERVLKAAEELGYRRDPRASALATGRNFVIGLMLPHIHSFATADPFYSVVTAGVAAVASRKGYNLMLYTSVAEEEGQRAAEKIDRRIDGLVLVIPPAETPIYEECRAQGIAVVSITQRSDLATMTVNSDDSTGASLATQHLIDLGHRRIAHLHGGMDICTSQLRREGFEKTMRDAGIEPADELILPGGFSRAIGYASTRELLRLKNRPTAIFACNDLAAHGAIEAIHETGLRVPEDISVVGYDDTWYSNITNPPLTTVDMNIDAIARRAAELLIATIEGREEPPHSMLPVSLTVRQSTARCPSESEDP